MEIIQCGDDSEGAILANRWLEDAINETSAGRIFVPAGNTPIKLYKIWQSRRPSYLSGKTLVQVDDIVTGESRGVFRNFLVEQLANFQEQIAWIATNSIGAEIALLGLGTNGHVAFHEPHVSSDFQFGCVLLSPITCARLGISEGTWGVSFGVGEFLRCQRILLMVYGESKREALTAMLQRDRSCPASLLLGHPGLTILTDLSVR